MDIVLKKVRKTAKENSFLTDEMIRDILLRLSIKSVMKCSLVCRRLRDIILSQDFVDLHLKSRNPLILVTFPNQSNIRNLSALDKWWEHSRTRFPIHKFPVYSEFFSHILFSHAGLIVLRRCSSLKLKFVILNPIRPSCEYVYITVCQELWKSTICAVYYNPLLNEYWSLWKMQKSRSSLDQPDLIVYKLLTLGSNPSFKTISNPFGYGFKDDDEKPLYIGNYLYWMLKSKQDSKYEGLSDILAFEIISEKFMVIPCPIPSNTECKGHQTYLVNNDGILSFVLILPSRIIIWRLEDHEEKLWTSMEYTITIGIFHVFESFGMIGVVDGILTFQSARRLFVCNLTEGTVKNYPKRKYAGNVSFFSHQMSLGSLKKCKYTLHIDRKHPS